MPEGFPILLRKLSGATQSMIQTFPERRINFMCFAFVSCYLLVSLLNDFFLQKDFKEKGKDLPEAGKDKLTTTTRLSYKMLQAVGLNN